VAALVSSIPTTAVRSLFRGGRNKIRRHRFEARAALAVGARSRVRLALQLHILLDMGFSSDGLMCASPDGPCNDVSGVDPSLRKADGNAADFLDRAADQWRWGFVVFDVVFRRFVFGGGVALA
jgi:hypothetical protein